MLRLSALELAPSLSSAHLHPAHPQAASPPLGRSRKEFRKPFQIQQLAYFKTGSSHVINKRFVKEQQMQ